jgi:putative NIF3 family GTP cyclohydrolase 1 type 2
MGIALIDAGHFATEEIYMAELSGYLKAELEKMNYSIDVFLSNENKSPFIRV